MSQPAAWTPEYIERLGKIGRGECLHDNTVEVWTVSETRPEVICWDCSATVQEECPCES